MEDIGGKTRTEFLREKQVSLQELVALLEDKNQALKDATTSCFYNEDRKKELKKCDEFISEERRRMKENWKKYIKKGVDGEIVIDEDNMLRANNDHLQRTQFQFEKSIAIESKVFQSCHRHPHPQMYEIFTLENENKINSFKTELRLLTAELKKLPRDKPRQNYVK